MAYSFPITLDVLKRLSGRTRSQELRDKIAGLKRKIEEHKNALTDERSCLYGQTFWMASSAEWLERDEAALAAAEQELASIPRRYPVPA